MSVVVMALVSAVAFGAATTLASAAIYPRLRARLSALPGRLRAQLLLLVVAAPLLVGVILSALALLPGVAAVVWPSLDHCMHHDDEHFHLCVVHAPAVANLALSWAVILGALVPSGFGLARTMKRVVRGRRLLAVLRRSARVAPSGSHAIVPSDAAFAVTAGLLSPQVYVTTGLLRDLDAPSQEAVLAHEDAHVRRRDPLRKLLGELAAAFHLPRVRRMLLDDLSLACEEACDEDAAVDVGDRTVVAGALVALGRIVGRTPPWPAPLFARFGDDDIRVRVLALLGPPKRRPALPSRTTIAVASLLLAAVAAAPLHHLTESLLGAFLG